MKNNLTVAKDMVMVFGDRDDGVIGIPVLTADGKVVEASYFFGTKHPKNIIAISSQAGCPMRCAFCELGGERFERNLTAQEMYGQVKLVLDEAAKYGFDLTQTPHKLTVANTGEPLLNPNVVDALRLAGSLPMTIKVSTVFPEATRAWENFERLAEFAAGFGVPTVQIQISLISTSAEQRRVMSGGRVVGFRRIREAAERWCSKVPHARKFNLSLMLADGMPCNIADVSSLFPPALFRFRFREYVPTGHGAENQLVAMSAAQQARIAREFSQAGYEVGDWGSPTPTERKFGLVANSIRQRYIDMVSARR